MAGLAPISMQQRCSIDGRPFPGALAYFYAAETLEMITPYVDYGLSVALPNPVQANAFGVFPPVFLDEAVGFYRIRITTADGVVLEDLTTLPVIGPSGGGGGAEVPVDPNTLRKPGDLFFVDGSGTRAGAVRANGRTIGSALSGATERANADCEILFTTLWARHDNARAPVIGGRGVSAAADWTGGKQLTLPDYRGRSPLGLDTMGNTSANRLSGVTFDIGNASTPGSTGGGARVTLTEAQLPVVTPNISVTWPTYTYDKINTPSSSQSPISGGPNYMVYPSPLTVATAASRSGGSISTTFGGGAAHTVLDPFFTVTWYYQL